MLEIVAVAYKLKNGKVPDERCICVDIYNMTNADTNERINPSEYLIEDYSNRYARAFSIEHLAVFKSKKKRDYDSRFVYLKTLPEQEGIWHYYEIIDMEIKKEDKVKPLEYDYEIYSDGTGNELGRCRLKMDINDVVNKVNEIIEYINKGDK